MATATHLTGVKTPYSFSKRALRVQSLCSLRSRIGFDPLADLCGALRVRGSSKGRSVRVVCDARKSDVAGESEYLEGTSKGLSCVMKFGGSSVASADRMKEVAELILSFPEEHPVIVLSAMGKTTNKLILAGELASSSCAKVSEIEELSFIKELHYRTIDELGLDKSLITDHLNILEQLLKGLAVMKELTPRQRDYIVSFGECMSTRIFAAYLNKIGVKARQAILYKLLCIFRHIITATTYLDNLRYAELQKTSGQSVVHQLPRC